MVAAADHCRDDVGRVVVGVCAGVGAGAVYLYHILSVEAGRAFSDWCPCNLAHYWHTNAEGQSDHSAWGYCPLNPAPPRLRD